MFIHYGYDKTTVRDIARGAGVSKGAIYLHFESKDDLFEALLIRELQLYAGRWLDFLEADPKGGTLAAMYKNMLYAVESSTFMTALLKQDHRIFGSYLHKPDNFFRAAQNKSSRYEFVHLMQKAGAIRQDIDATVIAHIMNIMAYGLVTIGEVMAQEDIPPMKDIIEGIALIMDKALSTEDETNSDVGKAIVRQIAQAGRDQLTEMKD